MKPYVTHADYVRDVKKLVGMITDAYKSDVKPDAGKLRTEMKERVALSTDIFYPLEHIAKIFFLSELEERLLFTLFVYETDGAYKEKLGSLTVHSLDALADICYAGEEDMDFSYSNFTENLLSCDDFGRFVLKKEITRFILNQGKIAGRPWKEYYCTSAQESCSLIFGHKTTSAFYRLIKSRIADEGWHIISVTGETGSGRQSLVRRAACDNGFSVLFLDCKALAYKNNFDEIIDEIKTESILTESIMCFRGFENILENGELLTRLLWEIKRVARLVFITSGQQGLDFSEYKYTVTEFPAPELDAKTGAALWEAEASAYDLDGTVDFNGLLSVFKLTPGQIKQAVQYARVCAVTDGAEKIGQERLMAACRYVLTKNIRVLGKIIEPVFKWDDLVLHSGQKEMLESAVKRVKFHKKVFNEWGFEKNTPYGAGVHILLHGSPGTGKTMAAMALAHELGLPIYKIDLSAVVSKYIGETEKSLSKVFEESQKTNSILFFDEADALFGKRSEIKDSHDRHANLQVSFLLQKIEEHQGVVLLATNLIKNFDDAFRRRFHFIINFSLPDAGLRKKIWKDAFPAETPLDGGVDFEYLAERFSLSGSNIKNIALASAFDAVSENRAVGMREIILAIKNETAKNDGAVLAGDVFEDFDIGSIVT